MERLTFEGNFCDIAQCAEVRYGSFCEDGACSQRKVWERLKAYEDTGLSPKICAEYKKFEDEAVSKGVPFSRIIKLMEADKDGRLVVLDEPRQPLVWGDDNQDTVLCPRCLCDLMGGFDFEPDSDTQMFQCPHCGQPIDDCKVITREGAERALNPCDRCMSGSYRGCDGCGYAEKTPEGGEASDH